MGIAILISILMAGLMGRFALASRNLVRAACRLYDELDAVDHGELIARRAYGSATINGVETHHAKIEVFEQGVAVGVHPYFGWGILWIPAEKARLSRAMHRGLFRKSERDLLTGAGHQVVLSPALSDPPFLAEIRRLRFRDLEHRA